MPEFRHQGLSISYDEYGEGERTLVLIHGLLLNRRMFDRLAPAIAERGHRVIALDLLGHGRSDRPPEMTNYSMTFFAQQVVALLDHLELEDAVIGGTSLGANTTLEMASIAPERVRAMMLEMPVLDNALLAVGVLFTPLLLALRFGEPAFRLVAAATSLNAAHESDGRPLARHAATGSGAFGGCAGRALPGPLGPPPRREDQAEAADARYRPPCRPAASLLGLRDGRRGAAQLPAPRGQFDLRVTQVSRATRRRALGLPRPRLGRPGGAPRAGRRNAVAIRLSMPNSSGAARLFR
ncbi:MAG: alpha/beta hydrolase [Solirubrobacterales bacterium]|nr:alpha/beta hydrolase [Solirubrobacterales bacterium]